MNAIHEGERTLTALDHARLGKLPAAVQVAQLQDILNNSDIVESRSIAPCIATMYTQLEVCDCHTRLRHKLTLCYPWDAEPGAGFISVLSPVGLALIGLPLGAVARWQTPSGEHGGAELVEILFQPEASGDYTT